MRFQLPPSLRCSSPSVVVEDLPTRSLHSSICRIADNEIPDDKCGAIGVALRILLMTRASQISKPLLLRALYDEKEIDRNVRVAREDRGW